MTCGLQRMNPADFGDSDSSTTKFSCPLSTKAIWKQVIAWYSSVFKIYIMLCYVMSLSQHTISKNLWSPHDLLFSCSWHGGLEPVQHPGNGGDWVEQAGKWPGLRGHPETSHLWRWPGAESHHTTSTKTITGGDPEETKCCWGEEEGESISRFPLLCHIFWCWSNNKYQPPLTLRITKVRRTHVCLKCYCYSTYTCTVHVHTYIHTYITIHPWLAISMWTKK